MTTGTETKKPMTTEEFFTGLWGGHETLYDGEYEYGCDFLVRADNEDDAMEKAGEYIKNNYGMGEDEDGGTSAKHYTECLNEDGVMELDGDYRMVEVSLCTQIKNFEDLERFIPTVIFGMDKCPAKPEPPVAYLDVHL